MFIIIDKELLEDISTFLSKCYRSEVNSVFKFLFIFPQVACSDSLDKIVECQHPNYPVDQRENKGNQGKDPDL